MPLRTDLVEHQSAAKAKRVTLVDSTGGLNPTIPVTQGGLGTIVTGTKTVTTAGTAVRITAASTPCKGVYVCADLGNTNPVVVGDSSVKAASGSQQGIVLPPGNPPILLPVSDLNMLWVDSQTNGDKLSYAYLN